MLSNVPHSFTNTIQPNPPKHDENVDPSPNNGDVFQSLYDSLAKLSLTVNSGVPWTTDGNYNFEATCNNAITTSNGDNNAVHHQLLPHPAEAALQQHLQPIQQQRNDQAAVVTVTPVFPPGDNVVFAHSSFFTRLAPDTRFYYGPYYSDLPTPAEVRAAAAEGSHAVTSGDASTAAARLVPFPALGLLVKYGRECGVGVDGVVGGVSPAEAKAMLLVRGALAPASQENAPSQVPLPVPEVFGWRRDAETGERFLYMDLPQGELLEDRWAGLSEVERETVCSQLRDMVMAWRRLRLEGIEFIGSVDNGPLQDEVFRECTLIGAPPAGPFPTVAAFHDYFVSMAVAVSQKRYPGSAAGGGAGGGQVRYTPHHLFPENVPVVFTHGGLHPRNIVVSAGPRPHVVAILGWEQAGWYPSYWELCKARLECSRRGRLGGWETKYLPWILDSQGLDAEIQGWRLGALAQYWDYFVGLMQ